MVLVVGATGLLGGLVVRRLLAEEHPVRALVRHGSDYRDLERAGAEIAFGDLKYPSSITQACRGMAAVVTTATSAARTGPDTLAAVDQRGNRVLIEAALEEGLEQFVFVSALGAGVDSPDPLLQAKGRTEQELRESALSFSILQPNLFMDVWLAALVLEPVRAGRPVVVPGSGQKRHTFVAAADVAEAAVAAVGNPAAMDRMIAFGGPQAVSLLDVVEHCAGILGRVIPVRHLGPREPVPGISPAAQRIAAALDTRESLLDASSAVERLGIVPTPVDRWLKNRLADLVQ
jgi:NADH dehydrogenase